MVPNVIERVWVQGTTTKVESLRGTAFTEEDGAHTFRIAGVDASGETVPLSGTVLAKILRADNITIDVSGTITDGVASVTMVGDCYHVPGRFSIVVYLSDGITTIAIYAAVGDIYRATSDTELDSGTTVPSLVQLEAAYQNALSAAAAANTAATGAERVNVSMSKSGDTITFSATDRTGATTTATMSDQSEEVADLESDVTDLENNVANLNSALFKTENLLAGTSGRMFFAVGNINTSNGVVDENPTGTRLISDFIYVPSNAIIVTNASTFEFVLLQYTANKEYVGYVGFSTSHTISASGYYRLMVRLRNNPSGDIIDYIETASNEIAIFDYAALNNFCSVYPKLISTENYITVLPDINSAKENTIYIILVGDDNNRPANLPHGIPTNGIAVVITVGQRAVKSGSVQLCFSEIKDIYMRKYSSNQWQPWVSISGKQNIIRVSALGAGDYTSFSEAIIAAFAVPNTIVYVDRGTYNVWDEMKAIMGNDYWDNLTEQTQYSYGLPWGNGMKIIGSPGAEIVFDGSQTTNDNTWYFFSPLTGRYVYGSDKTVSCEGLTFRVKNFRYAIHIDEGPINNDYTYIIKDCQFYCDNTGNPRTKASDAIGMGASINTTYIVENNYISASYAPTARDHENIYFHNTNAASPKNKCRISNNYMDNVGTIRVDGYGDSLNKCKVQINGNSCGSALILPNPTTDNLECLVWNNEIRSN